MKIGIANDHHGIELKRVIINHLESRNITYINLGCDSVETNVDYVDYAEKLCTSINNNEVDCGILICGTGIGMSIAANKIHGIRAAKVNTPKEAALAKEHNMANVITLAEYAENVCDIVDAYIDTNISNEERHIRRVNRIMELR